jgi:hypothetical protein
VPDAVVVALVGHESAAMSHRYTNVGKEALSALPNRFPKFENRTNDGCALHDNEPH